MKVVNIWWQIWGIVASKYNKLRVDIKDTNSIVTFKNSIRTHFL